MKKTILFVVLISTILISKAQLIQNYPLYTGSTTGTFLPVVIPTGATTYSNRKYSLDSLTTKAKYRADSIALANLLAGKASVAQLADSTTALQNVINSKQNTLTAGTNISIVGNTISSTGGGSASDSIFGGIYDSKVRTYTGVLRVELSGNNIVWSLLDDADHDVVGFTSVTTPTNTLVRLNYPAFSKILNFQISLDETLQARGISAGATVGLNNADILFTGRFNPRMQWNFNGSTWGIGLNSGNFISTISNSGNNIVITRIGSGPSYLGSNSEASYISYPVQYAGTNNRIIRYVTSGIGYDQTIVQLVDPTTGNDVAPNSSDKLIIWGDVPSVSISTQTVNNSSSLEKYFWNGTGTTNFWVTITGVLP
jgi:hypothetical protein